MRSTLAVCLLCCVGSAVSAPNRRGGANEVLIGEVDIAMHDGEDDGGGGAMVAGDDDSPETSTEQPFAKKCIVDNKAYSHSQMIPWTDSSSHCLCVAGEVYCWWQKYVASKSRSSNNPVPREEDEEDEGEEDVAEDEEDEDDSSSWTTEEESDYVEGPSESPEASGESALLEASGEQQDDHSIGVSEEEASAPETLANSTMSSSSSTTTTTATTTTTTARPTRAPATCLVMGRKYQEGEVLPHSTGNCVECSCGSEGRIECSPRDCVGLRPQSIEAAGTGDFELFDFEHERGIEENF